jgi:uncharacterized membrane protein
MKNLGKKIVFMLISMVCFIGAYNLVEWIFEGSDYKFNFKAGIAAPFVCFVIFSVLTVLFNKLSNKK